jgi:hypothetical protein
MGARVVVEKSAASVEQRHPGLGETGFPIDEMSGRFTG